VNRCGQAMHEVAPAGLPDDAVAVSVCGVHGWAYWIHDPYGQRLRFFVWQHGEAWGVTVVEPPLEGQGHEIGLTEQGGIQLAQEPHTLLDAFKVSVAWAASLAIARRVARPGPRNR